MIPGIDVAVAVAVVVVGVVEFVAISVMRADVVVRRVDGLMTAAAVAVEMKDVVKVEMVSMTYRLSSGSFDGRI